MLNIMHWACRCIRYYRMGTQPCQATTTWSQPTPVQSTAPMHVTIQLMYPADQRTCCAQVEKVLLYEHPAMPRSKCQVQQGRDVIYQDAIPKQSPQCDVEWLDAEAPLFLLYTSGSTGKPKGVVHTTGMSILISLVQPSCQKHLGVRASFVLVHSSGSTSKPKGIVHTTGHSILISLAQPL